MTKPDRKAPPIEPGTLPLLATTALAVSNLLVGLMQQNTALIAASTVLAAAFAVSYIWRRKLFPFGRSSDTDVHAGAARYGPKFSVWVYAGFVLGVLPALVGFVWYLRPTLSNSI